jgi:hypothetical protein
VLAVGQADAGQLDEFGGQWTHDFPSGGRSSPGQMQISLTIAQIRLEKTGGRACWANTAGVVEYLRQGHARGKVIIEVG